MSSAQTGSADLRQATHELDVVPEPAGFWEEFQTGKAGLTRSPAARWHAAAGGPASDDDVGRQTVARDWSRLVLQCGPGMLRGGGWPWRLYSEAAWALLLAWYGDWPDCVSFGIAGQTVVPVEIPTPVGVTASQWVELCRGCISQVPASGRMGADLNRKDAAGRHREPPFRTVISCSPTGRLADIGNFPWHLHLQISVGTRGVVASFCPEAYDRETVERLLANLERLLIGLLSKPDAPVTDLAKLDAEELRLVHALSRSGSVHADPAEPVHRQIADRAVLTPDRTAIEQGERHHSYRELEALTRLMAECIAAEGVRPGDRVGISMVRSAEMVAALLAVMRIGASFVPIDPAMPYERKRFIVHDAGLRIVVVNSISRSGWGNTVPVFDAETDLRKACMSGLAETSSRPSGGMASREAYVIYTSGTTGRPKGVSVGHGSLAHYVDAARTAFRIAAADRVLQFSSISFDAAVEEIFPCLTAGGTLVLRDDESLYSPSSFLRSVDEAGITVLDLPTAYWRELLALESSDRWMPAASLRLVIIGGEVAHPADLERWYRLPGKRPDLVNTYGPTEATVVSSMWFAPATRPETGWRGGVPIGRPIPGSCLMVIGRHGRPVPIGGVGELWIGGAGLALGYAGSDALTAERFVTLGDAPEDVGRFYRTGDRVRYLEDGNLDYLGRADSQVKVRGYRIELGEVDAVLRHQQGVRDAAVMVDQSEGQIPRLVAFVAPASDTAVTDSGLMTALRNVLPPYMVPSALTILPDLPKSTSGKVDTAALRAWFRQGRGRDDAAEERTAQLTDIETAVARIWRDVLGVEAMHADANFFDIGGDSLSAVKVMARTERELSPWLPPDQLYRTPVLMHFARELRQSLSQPSVECGIAGEQAIPRYDATTFQAWREREAALPVDLKPARRRLAGAGSGDVVLTGATGFLGAGLLRMLLEARSGRVICLVRAADPESGLERIRQAQDRFGFGPLPHDGRVACIPGDLTRNRLGLDEGSYRKISSSVSEIFHCAADVNMLKEYGQLREANVGGTRRIFELAASGISKTVNLISTLAILDGEASDRCADEDVSLDSVGMLCGGYAQSKWVAERMALNAACAGFRVRVYRCGRIWADGNSGAIPGDDFLLRLIRGCLDMRLFPDVRMEVDAAPVDFVARAIVSLAADDSGGGPCPPTFHICNPRVSTFHDVLACLRDMGAVFDVVSYPKWRGRMLEVVYGDSDAENPITALAPAFSPEDPSTWIDTCFPSLRTTQMLLRRGIRCSEAAPDLLRRLLSSTLKERVFAVR